jgi:hypothetical protein
MKEVSTSVGTNGSQASAPLSTSAIAENLLAELGQQTDGSNTVSSSTAWIKNESANESGTKHAVEAGSDVNLTMTAAQIVTSCKGLG